MDETSLIPLSLERKTSIIENTEWTPEAPVHVDELVEVHFDHYNFKGDLSHGTMIVHRSLGLSVVEIFRELNDLKFPIERALPSDHYAGDDVRCMEANNTSAFNARKVMNTDRWSSHAYGAAIDINPRQNPYVPNPGHSKALVFPSGGSEYLDRNRIRLGMVEPIVEIMSKYGFTDWGGTWETPIDLHHFQLPWEQIYALS